MLGLLSQNNFLHLNLTFDIIAKGFIFRSETKKKHGVPWKMVNIGEDFLEILISEAFLDNVEFELARIRPINKIFHYVVLAGFTHHS